MKRMMLLVVAVAVALAGTAFARPLGNHFKGKVGKAFFGFVATVKGGKVVKITQLSWEGRLCAESFTAGASKAITVKNDKFFSKQPVGGVRPGVHLTLTIQGAFKLDETKATGWLTLTGDCSTHGKRYWSATVLR